MRKDYKNRSTQFESHDIYRICIVANLTPDEIYTVELLIDTVRHEFDTNYWQDSSSRDDAREDPNYKPRFSKEHISPAAKELEELTWLSFQRLRDKQRPVRDLTALEFLPKLTGLVLINNEVSNIAAIAHCKELRRLFVCQNPIRDISALANCTNIEELEIGETPIEDFSALQRLPKLRELSISADQIPAFRQLEKLSSLQKLTFRLDGFDSFKGFPQMPELRVIRGAEVKSLDGLGRFPKLENVVNLSGEFDSLEPLRNSKALTHANILESRISSLEPIARLSALRSLRVSTDVAELDLTPLESLPALHNLAVRCNGHKPASLGRMKSKLSSWDIEFRSSKPRHTPSLELEIVDQSTFDVYDTKKPFNLTDSDTNEGLLSSELEWLDKQIEEAFSGDLKKDKDYTIPFDWGGARSRTVVLTSNKAARAFPRLALKIQKVLSEMSKDWIIYFQSDEAEPDFIVWIYPDKIMVTQKYADTVRKLITSK